MSELKTQVNDDSVQAFLDSLEDPQKREDSQVLCKLMQEVTGEQPKMWGKAIVGFGRYHYTYASGREGDWMATAFSPRKQQMTVYLMDGLDEHTDLLNKLGRHSTSKSCLYIKRLSDVDITVLRELISRSYKHIAQMYPPSV